MKSGGGDNRRPSWKSKEGDHITGDNILSILDRFLDSFQGENVPLAFMSSPCRLRSSPVLPKACMCICFCFQLDMSTGRRPRVVPVVPAWSPSSPSSPPAARQCLTPARRPPSSPSSPRAAKQCKAPAGHPLSFPSSPVVSRRPPVFPKSYMCIC